MDRLKIFPGSAHPELAEAICQYIGVEPSPIEIGRFPDGETKVRIRADARGDDCFVVQPTYRPVNENLMELLIIIDALKRASAGRITAVIPYYGYARQDRKHEGRVPITAKLVADLLTTAGVNRVVAMDLHASQIQGFFDIPLDHIPAEAILLERLVRLGLERPVVMSPDPGSIKLANSMARNLRASLALIDKRRVSDTEVEHHYIVGEMEDRDVVVIDDMIATGGSMAQAIKAARESKARSVHVAVTHAVFAGPVHERLRDAAPDEVIVTDTVPVNMDQMRDVNLTVLTVSPLLGEVIKRIHYNQSVSAVLSEYKARNFQQAY